MLSMRKEWKMAMAGMLAVGVMVTGNFVYAAGVTPVPAQETVKVDATLEKILVQVMEEESMTKGVYTAMVEKFGDQKPYSNLVRASERQVSKLEDILEQYDISWENKDNSSVLVPATLEEGYQTSLEAAKSRVALYDKFLKEDITEDIESSLTRLKAVAQRQVEAFERTINGECTGDGTGCENKNPLGQGRGQGQGRGLGRGAGRGNVDGGCSL